MLAWLFAGVPNPNGKLHASEIASLSLDILEHVNRMEIPHIPGTYVRLRIGCHTGIFTSSDLRNRPISILNIFNGNTHLIDLGIPPSYSCTCTLETSGTITH